MSSTSATQATEAVDAHDQQELPDPQAAESQEEEEQQAETVNIQETHPTAEASSEPVADSEIVNRTANIVFESHGEVILALKCPNGDQARFQVSSSVLCLASPVFRAMLSLDSGFHEAVVLSKRDASKEPLEIAFEDDDPNAMAVVLRILHYKHYWIPKSLTPERLYDVAIICDKYDLVQALETWLGRWTPTSFSDTITPDKWLFIAWVLGQEQEFHRLSQALMLECNSDDNGNLKVTWKTKDEHGSESTEYIDINTYLPDPILAEIKSTRQRTILGMIDSVNMEIEQYSQSDVTNCKHDYDTCDSVLLGLLLTGFKRLGAYPDASGIMKKSINEVRDHLRSVQIPEMLVLQKSTTGGCCETPQLNTGCLEAEHEQCTECHKCASCQNRYKPVDEVDHAPCSPLPRLMEKLDELVNGVVGLVYDHFISKNTRKSKPDVNDDELWYSLWGGKNF